MRSAYLSTIPGNMLRQYAKDDYLPMNQLRNTAWALIIFPLAGAASGLVTIYISNDPINGDTLGSMVFGVFLDAACWLFPGLRSPAKTLGFIATSFVAARIAVIAAMFTRVGDLPYLSGYDPECFVGGLIGSLLLVIAVLLLFSPRPPWTSIFLKGLLSALAGGMLGIAGKASGSLTRYIEPLLKSFPVRLDDADVSLILVWQAGMGLVLALVLWSESIRREDKTLVS